MPLFILGTLILFVFDKIGLLTIIQNLFAPIVKNLLGLPSKTTGAFLIGFLRRDYGAAGLFDLAKEGLLDSRQIVVSIVTISLFVPCLAQFLVMIKERGKGAAAGIFVFVIVFSVFVGAVLNKMLLLSGF